MAAADTEMDDSYNEAAGQSSPTRAGGTGAQLAPSSSQPQRGTLPAAAPQQQKQKFKITHDRYVELQNLVVYHLQEHETREGKGIDREELIDWYLESREGELESVEEINHEKDLFVKVLKKLVKVSGATIIEGGRALTYTIPSGQLHRGIQRRCSGISSDFI